MVNLRFLINVRWWWLETLRGRSTYISPRRVDVLFAHTACSYLWWNPGVVVRDRCNVFPQGFPPPCAGGGVLGAKRIARHLWRMCFGLFIAAGSFFLGPSNRPLRLLSEVGLGKHLSPAIFGTTLYLILTILPLILLIFWLVRVRWANAS